MYMICHLQGSFLETKQSINVQATYVADVFFSLFLSFLYIALLLLYYSREINMVFVARSLL